MQTDIGNGAELTVDAALDSYLKEHVAVRVIDQDRQEYGSRHVKRLLGTDTLTSIDIPASRQYVLTRKREGAANSTIRRELNILTSAANHNRRWKRISVEQMPQVELPEVAKSDEIEWFTKEQVASLFKARNSGHFACYLRIAYYTAGRRNSLQRMLKTQVDRKGERIHLARPGERITKKRRPTVPLYPEIRPAIDWLMDNSGTPWLFGRERDFYRPFVDVCAELGFEGNPHMLRHSRATHMLMDGESIYKVARLLGDTVATVEKVYGHSSVDFLQTGSGAFDAGMEDETPSVPFTPGWVRERAVDVE